MQETSLGDFHYAGYFFGGIFMMLETSSWIFTVLETSLEGFSQCWRLFGGIFTVLVTSLDGFSRC